MGRKNLIKALVIAVLAVAGLFAGFATSAKSDDTQITHISTQQIWIGKASFSGEDFARGLVTVLSDMNLRAGVKVSSKNCFWTKPGQKWKNYGYGPSGLQYEIETVPGRLCRTAKGLVKVAGGHTGRRCFNRAQLVGPPLGKPAVGRVIWVRTFGSVQMHIRAHEQFDIHASCGNASGEAAAEIWLNLGVALRARGAAVMRFFASVRARAWTRATAQIICAPPVTVPGPATTVVTTTSGPTTTVVVTTTTTSTTTAPTTTVQPKSNTDLCTNLPGEQTAVPAFYKKDGPPDTPGTCYYVGP